MALDFGLKRTGIAVTDESNIIATGLKTIDSKNLMQELKELIDKFNIGTIVLGEPKRLNAEDTHISENVRQLKIALSKNFPKVSIEMMDERFTSKIAFDAILASGISKKKRQDKGLVDEVSATIILQDYLGKITR